ncbi:MAG: glycosyltransferase [Polyangiaceae bacterium]
MTVLAAPSEDLLQQNLEVLTQGQPALAMLLHRAVPAQIGAAHNGEPTCKIVVDGMERLVHSAYDPGGEARRQAERVPPEAGTILCLGAGLGYLPLTLLERPDLRLMLLEPELPFLRMMLSLFDCREYFRTGRLTLVTSSDVDIAALSSFASVDGEVAHPVLGPLYADHRRHFRYLTHLRDARGKVIVVHNKLFASDLAELFEQRGFAVRTVNSSDVTLRSFQALVSQIEPSFMFTVNYSPEIALLCSRAKVPYVSWTIDPIPAARLRVLQGTDTSLCVVFAHRRFLVEELRRIGFDEVGYLPLAAPAAKRFHVEDEARLAPYRCNVSFVGSSLVVEENGLLRWMRHLGGTDALEQRMTEFIEQTFQSEGREMSYLGLAEDGSQTPQWLAEGLSAEMDPVEASDRINGALSHRLRIDRVRACRQYGMRAYGDEGWEVCGDLYHGRAEHGDELTSIYNASRVNLDIPRIYQRDIVTMRVFDVLLCGGVLVTEPSSELLELFSADTHLATYRNEAELIRLIGDLNEDPERARALAVAGRKLVTNKHTMHHRVAAMLEELVRRGLGGEDVAQALE